MLALKWKDKRDVSMLSTIHDDSMVEKRRRTRLAPNGTEVVQKPRMVEEYNMHMGGVDKSEYQVHVHMKHSIKCNQYNYMWVDNAANYYC